MKDPIVEEVRRIRAALFEEWQRDPQAYEENKRRRLSKYFYYDENGKRHLKPQDPPLDPLTAALRDADLLPRVARRIRRRKILAKAAAERFENARRILESR